MTKAILCKLMTAFTFLLAMEAQALWVGVMLEAPKDDKQYTRSAETVLFGDIVSFQSVANDRNVVADLSINSHAPLYANRDWVRKWERFLVEDAGDGYISLRALATNKYVAADFYKNGGKLVANSEAISDRERFYWSANDDGTVSLRSKESGRYVVAGNAGKDQLAASNNTIDTSAKFLVTKYVE